MSSTVGHLRPGAAHRPGETVGRTAAAPASGRAPSLRVNFSWITAGNAVKVVGSCRITLIGCHIEAGKAAVAIMGSGVVVIRDSYIKGRQAAVKIVGSGTVKAKNSRIFGKVKAVGTARFVDQGGNTIK